MHYAFSSGGSDPGPVSGAVAVAGRGGLSFVSCYDRPVGGGSSCAYHGRDSYGRLSGYHGRSVLLWGSGKKLEILKDPHLGAFAVIYTFAYMLLYAGASCEFAARAEGSARLLPVLFMTMERAFSGLSVLSFCQKRRPGSLFCTGCREENRPYGNDAVAVSHRCSVLAFGRFKLAFGSSRIFVLLLILFVWFYRWSKKQFGGITGDLAGFYLQAGELVCLIAALVLAGWVSNNVGG